MSGNTPTDRPLILGSSSVEAACASPELGPEASVPTAKPCNDNIGVSVVGDIAGDEIDLLAFGIIIGIVLLVALTIVTTIRVVRARRQAALRQLVERGTDDLNENSGG